MVTNRRFLLLAAWCRELAIPAAVLAALMIAGWPTNNTYALMSADVGGAKITADVTNSIDAPAPAAAPINRDAAPIDSDAAPINTDAANTDSANTDAANTNDLLTDHAPSAAEPVVVAALEAPAEQRLEKHLDEPIQADRGETQRDVEEAADQVKIADECLVIEICVDDYLWQLYQRTRKEDSISERTQRQVTIKRKGKLVTVTKSSTTVVDEDFGWKDAKAADKAGLTLMDYVIGGVDRDFKLRLFQMLHAAEQAGLAPGITSAFRDDYRQSIAAGLKAANDRSFHGGSFHGGYGHGLAADIVSVKGATRRERLDSSQLLWKWVDGHGSDFGLGRPYLGRDPPHVAPNDGDEYARHRGGAKAQQATSAPPPQPVAQPSRCTSLRAFGCRKPDAAASELSAVAGPVQ